MSNLKLLIALLLVLVCVVFGCAIVSNNSSDIWTDSDSGSVWVQRGSQLRIGGLEIGIVNVEYSEYEDTNAVTRGPTAWLSVAIPGDPTKNRRMKVHIDQEFRVEDCWVKVVDIDDDESPGFVRLAVRCDEASGQM